MGVITGVGSSARSATGSFASSASEEDTEGDETWARVGLAPLMATLFLPIIIGVILLIKCVFGHCCVRRTTTKEEMYGVEGRMTMIANTDTAFLTPSNSHPLPNTSNERALRTTSSSSNHSTSHTHGLTQQSYHNSDHAPHEESKPLKLLNINNNREVTQIQTHELYPTTSVSVAEIVQIQTHSSVHRTESDSTDTLKRVSGKRQLPDLPEIPPSHLQLPRRSSSVLSQDGTSELYATVGDVPNPTGPGAINPYAHLKSRKAPSGNDHSSKPSTSRNGLGHKHNESGPTKGNDAAPSSDSETYATSSSHPYAKLKRNSVEHPYARVRNANIGNDEETDTDNYDLPQSYAQARSQQASSSGLGGVGVATNGAENEGPVPPRRIGRQWRRGSHPQGQNSTDSTSHFSGDSQDSRGYTSISVREPLSNIRSQMPPGVRQDSHYATVSDDSEEMYAAIDDSSEGNYMQIDGERPSRPSWLDAANVASPIPERREANSPLPPVPAVPPPTETPGSSTQSGIPATAIPNSPAASTQLSQPQSPPVYAQVTKKSKKQKAPVTPTASNSSVSSQPHIKEHESLPLPPPPEPLPPVPLPSLPSAGPGSGPSSSSNYQRHHHRSKSRTLMDNSNLLESDISEPRRWSKADISYSEFEVVRESLVPSSSPGAKSPISMERQEKMAVSPRDSVGSRQPVVQELIDEDNYNVIPDKIIDERPTGRNKSSHKIRRERERVDSDNYQEIEPISNTYQEIGGGKEPSDHYQEIGAGTSASALQNGIDMDNFDNNEQENGSALYQEIHKKEYDDEDDEEDQFYEKVRPSTSKQQLDVPASRSTRKHGYEKLKRKPNTSPSPKGKSATSDDDEDDEEGKLDEDLMYERVKYPPYERLKESRSDLAVDEAVDDDDDDGNNFYEHIGGYSKVQPKHKRERDANAARNNPVEEKCNRRDDSYPNSSEGIGVTESDVNQLYAVVDKTKKKSKSSSSNKSSATTTNNHNYNFSNNNPNPLHVGDRDSNLTERGLESPSTSSSNIFNSRIVNIRSYKTALPASLAGGPDLEFIDDSNDIEYI